MDKILRGRQDHHHHRDQILMPGPPPLMRILDFVQSKLPLGMGLFKFGNFLYMFGGEYYPTTESDSDSEYENSYNSKYSKVYGAGLNEENPPCPVYKLDLTDNLSEPLQLSSMFGPKLYAIVEEIGGQIYVLSRKRVSSTRPLFEVWNPMTDQWRALPNPPSFSSEGMDIWSHCVCDGKIICNMQSGPFNRFFITSETWDCVENLSSSESMAMNVKNVSSDMDSKNVYFTVHRGGYSDLWAFMDGPISSEEKASYSIELEFDRSKTNPEIPGFSVMGSVILVDTSQHGEYMCGLVPYHRKNTEHAYGFGLYVFVFLVEKIKLTRSPPTLSVRYLRRQFYDFINIRCGDEGFIIKKAIM